jgi:hypothetical protein
MVSGKASGGDLLVRLRMGRRWCPRPRRITQANVARMATPREVSVGMPIGALEAAA